MTGRDLIVYILANGLENEPVYKEGRLLGFMTVADAAVKFHVGLSTIETWVLLGALEGLRVGDILYIPANAERPVERSTQRGIIVCGNGV